VQKTIREVDTPSFVIDRAVALAPEAAEAGPQPYTYERRALVEPDWTRLPGWRDVTPRDWESARWQRANCVRNLGQLRWVYGDLLPDSFYADLELDQAQRATMAMLLTPQIVNTIVPEREPDLEGVLSDPVRRYMLPAFSDRATDWPSHPFSARDSLGEREMWVVEGLTHRYPTKVLAEIVATCPQYCGHCTRMDLVGDSTAQVEKVGFELSPAPRRQAMIDYLRRTPGVRDVVVSGGDVTNVPWKVLEQFFTNLLEIDSIRDIRLASKGLMGLPQHWLQEQVQESVGRMAALARSRGVQVAIHTHINAAQSVTPLVAKSAQAMLAAGVRDVRNQGVLLRGVNNSVTALLDLCFALLDEPGITPYYMYMCDMIPNAEHWRLALWEAQELQEGIMGYPPGFATPRFVCDVPYVGKRWVHQAMSYDRELGVSYWTKNYRTNIERGDPSATSRFYLYFDPIHTLPATGQAQWRQMKGQGSTQVDNRLISAISERHPSTSHVHDRPADQLQH